LEKLMENEAVRSYVAKHAPEILDRLELVLSTVSVEQAVEMKRHLIQPLLDLASE